MANVWGYWDCPYCGQKHIRGDNKSCINCGSPIPPNTKFYITPENGVEYVAHEQENKQANWICDYCDTQNKAQNKVCSNCGSPRGDASKDYFGRDITDVYKNEWEMSDSDQPDGMTDEEYEEWQDGLAEKELVEKRKREQILSEKEREEYQKLPFWDKLKDKLKSSFKVSKTMKQMSFVLALMLLFSLVFLPITRSSEISGFKWERTIQIERFDNYDESDWSLPKDAHLHYTTQEVHHYEQVLDHYETKTRQVPHQELDGYDTEYKDLGNGQFEEVKTPRYKTVWETETYEEPVYRDEPVYQTKYYYDIDRWEESYTVDTVGNDHDPEWGEIPAKVIESSERSSSPEYGDERENGRSGKYYAVIKDKKGKKQKVKYPESEWNDLSVGDKIKYKTFWWSNKPIKRA